MLSNIFDEPDTEFEKLSTKIPDKLICYVDGGCHGNGTPEAKAYGSWKVNGGDPVRHDFASAKTNNEAEFYALISLLLFLKEQGYSDMIIKTDSALMFNQLRGLYQIKAENLVELNKRAKELIQDRRAELQWVSRNTIVQELGH